MQFNSELLRAEKPAQAGGVKKKLKLLIENGE